ncbi:MAG: Dabb family protein [Pseudolysinimonas sp.]
MILHLASFRWNDDVTEQDVAGLTDALRAMAAGIPELRSYQCGESLRLRPGGADYGVAAIVDDDAGLSAYLDSAAHAAVYETYLGRMIAERAAVQLPVGDGACL